MSDTSDFRNGLCIQFNNDLYIIVNFQHVKPGKGGAFVRTKLKSLTTGKVIDNTFNAGCKIITARIERSKYQFLYKESTHYYFMSNTSFEQISLQEKIIHASNLLKEGQIVDILIHSEKNIPLACELPAYVELQVTHTEPGIRGSTANKSFKPATLETGFKIQVPLFINQGDLLKIDTRNMSYAERVKK